MTEETLLSLFRRFGKCAMDLFAPPRCRACGTALWGHAAPFLCPECVGAIRWIGAGACRKCGFPAGTHAAWGASGCLRCRGRNFPLSGVAAVARYSGGARHLVKSLKFRHERAIAPALGALMAERWLSADLSDEVDLVVPVSLHPKRRRERGFDQSALLAKSLSTRLGLSCAPALHRVKATRPQSLLRRKERLSTMSGVFEADAKVQGRTILLVDDVFTTGTTMSAAATACKRSGAKKVYGIAFAR